MRRRRDEGGQAAAELALVLPLVLTLLLAAVQVVVVLRDQLLVAHAAREAARHLAVDNHAERAQVAAARGSALKVDRLVVETSYKGGSPGMVIAAVSYRSATDVPLVGPLVPDLNLRATAAMRDESGHKVAATAASVKNQQERRHDPAKQPSVATTASAGRN